MTTWAKNNFWRLLGVVAIPTGIALGIWAAIYGSEFEQNTQVDKLGIKTETSILTLVGVVGAAVLIIVGVLLVAMPVVLAAIKAWRERGKT